MKNSEIDKVDYLLREEMEQEQEYSERRLEFDFHCKFYGTEKEFDALKVMIEEHARINYMVNKEVEPYKSNGLPGVIAPKTRQQNTAARNEANRYLKSGY